MSVNAHKLPPAFCRCNLEKVQAMDFFIKNDTGAE
jgi:hypothetical protein